MVCVSVHVPWDSPAPAVQLVPAVSPLLIDCVMIQGDVLSVIGIFLEFSPSSSVFGASSCCGGCGWGDCSC